MKRLCALLALAGAAYAAEKSRIPASPLDQYVSEANARAAAASQPANGSIWSPGSPLSDGARDLRASQVDDVVTILVVENATAVAKGSTKAQRASSASNNVTKLAGVTSAAGALANLASLAGSTQLAGEGATSRDVIVGATLTARIAGVLPNGALVVEGSKDVQVNSERQTITLRAVVRPADISPGNTVPSDRLAQLELRVNGKGVVGDAIRRPFFLYRLLLGLLPF